MSREIITNDFGEIKLGDNLLPGIVQQIEVDGNVRIDSEEVPGQSGASKQPQGFDDYKVTIRIALVTDDDSDCYDKVTLLEQSFKKVDAQAKPFIYRVINKHLAARGISQMVYQGLRTTDSSGTDVISAEISLLEYKPVIVKTEQAVVKVMTTEAPSANEQYVVKSGDSMYQIARTYGVSLADLEKANPQIDNPNLIYPGQQLNIPSNSSGTGGSGSPAIDDDLA